MNDTLNTSITSDFESNFNSDFDINLTQALNLSEQNFSYSELIEFLKSDEITKKQIAALKLEEINSKEDAKILVSNLVGQDGKIREAVAFKLAEFVKNPSFNSYFLLEDLYETYMQAIMDINGNVCRNMVEFIVELSLNEPFREYICRKLPEMLNSIWENIEELDLSAKQYTVSKRNFQLYWCLEATYHFVDKIPFDQIKDILFKTGEFYDYTIREKAAKIVAKLDNNELCQLKEKLKTDENYYVRRYLN